VARPVAHRGLHDRDAGLIENSLEAADAALAGGFGVECDVQASQEGEPIVFHDDTLDRLTEATGELRALDLSRIGDLKLKGAAGVGAVPTLSSLLDRMAGRAPLIVEIKSRFDGDMRLAERVAALASDYAGPIALKSFDPAVIVHLRRLAPANANGPIALGIVGETRFDHPDWNFLSPAHKQSLANLLHWADTRPDFLSWAVRDLPHAGAHLARVALGLPVLAWTVRTPSQWARTREFADQAIFEGRAD
jgi:glycerophosphoryl diester phosphodiesterase